MIVNHLPELIERRGWSAYRLSEESGIHYKTCRLLVLHKKPSIRFDLLDTICETLGCQPGEVYSYQRAPRPSVKASKKTAAKKPAKKAASSRSKK
jgi:putative transcriptional regulator